jgi:hypothetical protein
VHLARFITLQANYVLNRNDVTLFASSTTPAAFHEPPRESSHRRLRSPDSLRDTPAASGHTESKRDPTSTTNRGNNARKVG